MTRQLALMDQPKSWRLDDRTKEVGRRGIAEARAALAAHRPKDPQPSAA